jgi:rRNA-processing protein FCF1
MRILLDTNIFILREDDKVISQELQDLWQILSKIKTEILIHPLSIEELKGDKDETRREIILSKVGSYPIFESPPDLSKADEFNKRVSEANDHDRIDNNLLYTVCKNAVDFLITEDRGIHKKATEINVQDRVLLIDDALQMFKTGVTISKPISPPALKEDFVYNLDLSDPIFDKLKSDYPEFVEKWFPKISKEGRKCWVHHKSDGKIGALLIFKIEDEPIEGTPALPKKKRLKISTFIVTNVGQKIGELFIKLSIDFCVKNGLSEMYLTHFTEPNDRLVQLISEYGFRKVTVNPRREEIFLKCLIPESASLTELQPLQFVSKYYPSFYDGTNVRVF